MTESTFALSPICFLRSHSLPPIMSPLTHNEVANTEGKLCCGRGSSPDYRRSPAVKISFITSGCQLSLEFFFSFFSVTLLSSVPTPILLCREVAVPFSSPPHPHRHPSSPFQGLLLNSYPSIATLNLFNLPRSDNVSHHENHQHPYPCRCLVHGLRERCCCRCTSLHHDHEARRKGDHHHHQKAKDYR